jgi:hypothetical protein
LGKSDRIDELHKIYGWNLTLKSLSSDPLEMEKIVNMNFGSVLTFLELNKAEEEIIHISQELIKNKYKT